jgi:hypothetical protein
MVTYQRFPLPLTVPNWVSRSTIFPPRIHHILAMPPCAYLSLRPGLQRLGTRVSKKIWHCYRRARRTPGTAAGAQELSCPNQARS